MDSSNKEVGEVPEVTKVVAAVIFSDDEKSVLVAKRARNKPFPNKWEFIGGKVEEDESFEDAIKRETFEETGLFILPLGPLGEARFKAKDGLEIDVTFFECEAKSSLAEIMRDPKIQSRLRWVDISDLEKLDWVGANGEFAKWFAEYSKKRASLKKGT